MYEINIKTTKPQTYLYIRRQVSVDNATKVMNDAFDEVFKYIKDLKKEPIFPCFGLYPDPEFNPNDFQVDSCVPIDGKIPEKGDIKFGSLPEQKVVSTIHKGSYEQIKNAYDSIRDLWQQNKFELIGPPREIYIVGALDTQNPEEYQTEINQPIAQ